MNIDKMLLEQYLAYYKQISKNISYHLSKKLLYLPSVANLQCQRDLIHGRI